MELRAYLNSRDLSEADFAKLIGVKQSAVNRYCRKIRTPKPKVMSEIIRVTKGKVTANDFVAKPGDA